MTIEDTIKAALVDIRPHLARDGGDVEFVSYDAELGIAYVRFSGACRSCAMSAMTLRAGIERAIRLAAREVRRVEAIP